MNGTAEATERLDVEHLQARSDRAHANAKRAIALIPGRTAASIAFTREEVDALQTILLGLDHYTAKSEASMYARLEELGITEEWYQVFVKVSEASDQLSHA
jgi:hypothetical protein